MSFLVAVFVATGPSAAHAQDEQNASGPPTRRFVLMGAPQQVAAWEEPLRIELAGQSVHVVASPAPRGETRSVRDANAARTALDYAAEASIYVDGGSVRVVAPGNQGARGTPLTGRDPRTIAMIAVSLLEEPVFARRAPQAPIVLHALASMLATPNEPTYEPRHALADAPDAEVVHERVGELTDVRDEDGETESGVSIHPYFGVGLGGAAVFDATSADFGARAHLLVGVAFTEFFRVQLSADGGTLHDREGYGEFQPYFRVCSDFIGGIVFERVFGVHVGARGCVGATETWDDRNLMFPTESVNAVLSVGGFFALTHRASDELEIWIRLELDGVASMQPLRSAEGVAGLSVLLVVR